jgi:hypothetical protein
MRRAMSNQRKTMSLTQHLLSRAVEPAALLLVIRVN